jgi:hypothetical protein
MPESHKTTRPDKSGEKDPRPASRPTVTANGQVMWSTRDLLFPTGRPARSVKLPKK